MPKTLCIPRDAGRSGISVTYTKSRNVISVSGYYDSCVGIDGESFALYEFFELLEIPAKNVRSALKIMESRDSAQKDNAI